MIAQPDNQSTTPKTGAKYLVRHGVMRFIGVFTADLDFVFRRQETVIIRSDRGLEAGELLCPATPQAVAAIPEPTSGQLVRSANDEDRKRITDIVDIQKREYTTGRELIVQHKLAMQIVDVEHLFGGERVVFYFLSESRVDFRELVKSMAREFHARIELRQIGVRDEAKLLADYGDCGKPVCCNTHMVVMPPVSMRMAKLQKSTLRSQMSEPSKNILTKRSRNCSRQKKGSTICNQRCTDKLASNKRSTNLETRLPPHRAQMNEYPASTESLAGCVISIVKTKMRSQKKSPRPTRLS